MIQRLLPFTSTLLTLGAPAWPSIMSGGQEAGTRKVKTGSPAAQRIICESEYINFAFAREHRGIYVDREGKVYSYAYQRGDRQWHKPFLQFEIPRR